MNRARKAWILPGLLLPVLLAFLALPGTGTAGTRTAAPVVTAVEAIGMTVSDMERSLAFYQDVLDFETVSDAEYAGTDVEHLTGVFGARVRVVTLRIGGETIELSEFLAPTGRPIPADFRSNDLGFQHIALVVSDMDAAYIKLRGHRVRHASTGPQRLPDWNPNAGGIEAFYFRDPDGHHLEVIAYPRGKGDPRWQDDTRLFLGIDHTAIVVSDTEASLAVYRDLLGLELAGTSENYGTEQEHLNNVFGARLRITALRAARGPGIEFLEYLAPGDGRPMPTDEAANDLFHWHIRLVTGSADSAWSGIRAAGVPLVSPGFVTMTDNRWTFRQGLRLRDPDGHVLEVIKQ